MNDQAPKTHIFVLIAGVAAATFAVCEAIAKTSAGRRPSLDDAAKLVSYMHATSTNTLLVVISDTLLMAALIVFFVGLRFLIKRASTKPEWVSDVGVVALLIYVTITLIGDSMDGGTALDTTLSVGSAAIIRTLIESHILLFGPIGSVFIVLTIVSFSYALRSSGIVSRWISGFGYGVALLNAFAILMVFRSIGSIAHGNEVTLAALVAFILWILVTGIIAARSISIQSVYDLGKRHLKTVK